MTLFEHFEKMHEPKYAFEFIKAVSDFLLKSAPHSKISFTEGDNNDFSLNVNGDLFSQINGKLKSTAFKMIYFNNEPDKFLEKLDGALETHLFQCNYFMKATLPALKEHGIPLERLQKARNQWLSVPYDISKVCEALWDQPDVVKAKKHTYGGICDIQNACDGVTAFIKVGGKEFVLSDDGVHCEENHDKAHTYAMFSRATRNIRVKYPELAKKFDPSVVIEEDALPEPTKATTISSTPTPVDEFTL